MSDPVVILGLGFTTQRLARLLRERGVPVYAAVRRAERFAEFAEMGVRLCALTPGDLPRGVVLVHSVPPLAEPDNSRIRALIRDIEPRRILYISSTGVYGALNAVSESSPASPNDEKGRARVAEEEWMVSTKTPCLILRSAAIYGPGRGIHVRLSEGRWPLPNPPRGAGGTVSRIHVDDLAAILEAGLDSLIEGAWPVADDHPAPSEEVAAWCAEWMGFSLPDGAVPHGSGAGYPVTGRRVNGKKIRELLGVTLKHGSYQTGIPASLVGEAASLQLQNAPSATGVMTLTAPRRASSASTKPDTSTLPTPSA